jgi:hypothetical protein
MAKKYSHTRVKSHRSYSVDDVCKLFADKKLHPQTVRAWIKEGLKVIGKKPFIIHGQDLKAFLEERNKASKKKLTLAEFKCLSCHEIEKPIISVIRKENGSLFASGICPHCQGKVAKICQANDFDKLQYLFTITNEQEQTRLYSNDNTSLNTHL